MWLGVEFFLNRSIVEYESWTNVEWWCGREEKWFEM